MRIGLVCVCEVQSNQMQMAMRLIRPLTVMLDKALYEKPPRVTYFNIGSTGIKAMSNHSKSLQKFGGLSHNDPVLSQW